jgi:hypothetical protein
MYVGGGNTYKILVGKPDAKRPLGRPRRRWEDIRLVFREVGGKVWTAFIWIRIATSGRL